MKRATLLTIVFSAFVLGVCPPTSQTAHAGQRVRLAVVVAANTDLVDVSLADLRRVFAGAGMNDNSGKPLIPLNHAPRSGARAGFDRIVLGLNPEEVGRFWIDRKIRGLAGPPRSLDSIPLLLRLVQRFPGAISYARSPLPLEGLRVLRVNGKRPQDPGYALEFDE